MNIESEMNMARKNTMGGRRRRNRKNKTHGGRRNRKNVTMGGRRRDRRNKSRKNHRN